ncbi:unnamed protein product [Mytilus edulis]|uniref:Uncharacterized protein n=1 Tax=Mytilus edulis TaxID=6550 RepID=A0A8S3TDR5_MYTED|nr:unnamed protein product [Mytilus edulis]
MESGFNPEKVQVRQEPAWVTLGGETPSLTTHVPSAEEVLNGYRYGALVNLGDNHLTMVIIGYDDTCGIHEKEAEAILKALQSLGKSLLDSRVDVLTDSTRQCLHIDREIKSPGLSLREGIFCIEIELDETTIFAGDRASDLSLVCCSGGCAVTMALSGAAENVDQAMKHIGWFAEQVPGVL